MAQFGEVYTNGRVAELVDAPDLGSGLARGGVLSRLPIFTAPQKSPGLFSGLVFEIDSADAALPRRE